MNLTEILKNVPSGTKMYSPLFKEPITFVRVNKNCRFPIICRTSASETIEFDNRGYFLVETASQNCMIFPTPEMTWDGYEYVPEGFLVICKRDNKITQIACSKGGWSNDSSIPSYWWYDFEDDDLCDETCCFWYDSIATSEELATIDKLLAEKDYLFKNKKLEKVKTFKKGDIVVSKGCVAIVDHVGKFGSHKDVVYYQCCIDCGGEFNFGVDVGRACDCIYASTYNQERILKKLKELGYVLKGDTVIKKRFDPKTFEPYQKVLVRSTSVSNWRCTFFSHMSDNKAICSGDNWSCCIPYENNEHLRGTSEDCDDFYKWWENN